MTDKTTDVINKHRANVGEPVEYVLKRLQRWRAFRSKQHVHYVRALLNAPNMCSIRTVIGDCGKLDAKELDVFHLYAKK